MANALLTPSWITRKALAILHQKLNFVGSINRAYDDSFAKDGAKIGSALRIRLPNQYTVVSGATLAGGTVQDTTEFQTTLNVTSQKHVEINFTSAELALSADDFAHRYLEPAMAVLAATVEADALTMTLDVYNQINGHGAAQTFRNLLLGKKALVDNLAPPDAERYCRFNTTDTVDVVDALKGLFQDSASIAAQYRDGVMGRTAGLEIGENTFLTTFARGAGAGYLVNGAGQTGTTLAVNTGAGAMNKGDIFTIAGVFRVHPETKANTNVLQQFVVTAAYAGGAGNITIAPAITVTGPTQTVNASPGAGAVMTFAGSASGTSGVSLVYHKNAFTFATADLMLPGGVDFAYRAVMDGISLRLVRQYDITNDKWPCRIDILYGFQTIRPQLAARLAAN